MSSITSSIAATTGAITSATNTVNAVVASADNFGTALRTMNIPLMGEAVGDIMGAFASFEGDQYPNDWRVRLSIANWTSFRSSPVLKPLIDAGGLIFPYTPTINISSNSTYTGITTTHTNYTHQAFARSDPGEIKISAPMYVEDAGQALYWIAAVHYLRSLTKMFSGNDMKAGNPPPIVQLNGYGNYVFKNVPVVITNFTCSLSNDCDYIGVEVVGSMAGQLEGLTDSISGVSNALGSSFSVLSPVTNVVSGLSNTAGQIAGVMGAFGVGGTVSGGVTHVPTKSTLDINLQPVYSRTSSRKFSLDRFVTGGYLDNPIGYI